MIINIRPPVNYLIMLAILTSSCGDSTLAKASSTYFEKCAEAMGEIPSFNCLNGTEIPITKNGIPLFNSPKDEECDKKIQFNGQDNPCVPFSRLLLLPSRENVLTVAICRKYSQKSIDARVFDDIAIIQHDTSTGNTCFFQSNLKQNLKLDGKNLPSPQKSKGQKIWTDEEEFKSVTPCTSCHDADPFIWSPYIAQVIERKAGFEKLWSPEIAHGPWNSNYLDVFGEHVKTFEPDDNVCAYCHRIGSKTCKSLDNDSISVVEKYVHEGWMPMGKNNTMPKESPFFNKEKHIKNFESALAEIKTCCKKPNVISCNTKEAMGRNVERQKSKIMIGKH